MSTINGTIKNGGKIPAPNTLVTFTLYKTPVIDGQALIGGQPVTARTDGVGFFSVILSMGDWRMSALGVEVLISVPADDNTYSFNSRVVGNAIYNPTAPPGGADPNASATTLGLVKTYGTEPTPVVPLWSDMVAYVAAHGGGGGGGSAITAFDTLASLKAFSVPANGTEVILTGIAAADDLIASEGRVRRYLYRSASTAAANDGGVLLPNAGVGRYIQI